MTGVRVILHDGTVYDGSTCGYAEGFLWCYIVGFSLAEVSSEFFNTAATDEIVFEYGEMSVTYEDFTVVQFMQATEAGCNICLVKQS